MPHTLQGFGFGAIERALCPNLAEQLRRYGLQEQAGSAEGGKGGGRIGAEAETRFSKTAEKDRLSSLPLELFLETCSYLDARDLLRLSLVNQNLFSRLREWSYSATLMWTAALGQDGLFNLLDDSSTSVIQCAFLVYGDWCQIYAKTEMQDVALLFRQLKLRCCKCCAFRLVKDLEYLQSVYPNLHSNFNDCCASTDFAPMGATSL